MSDLSETDHEIHSGTEEDNNNDKNKANVSIVVTEHTNSQEELFGSAEVQDPTTQMNDTLSGSQVRKACEEAEASLGENEQIANNNESILRRSARSMSSSSDHSANLKDKFKKQLTDANAKLTAEKLAHRKTQNPLNDTERALPLFVITCSYFDFLFA